VNAIIFTKISVGQSGPALADSGPNARPGRVAQCKT